MQAPRPAESRRPSGGQALAAAVVLLLASGGYAWHRARSSQPPPIENPTAAEPQAPAAPPPAAPPAVAPKPPAHVVIQAVSPRKAIVVAPASEPASRVGLAIVGDRLVAGWVGKDGLLGFASSDNGGHTWERWPSDPRMKPTAAQDLDLVGAGGNLHVSWTTRQPDGRYRLYAACARGPAQSFSEPILLGGATDCGDASSLSAGSLGGGSDLVLVTWEATPAGASSKRTALLAAWMSDDGHLLAAPAALWEERNAPNRGAWSDLRAMVSQRKAVLYFEDVFRKDDNTKALFMARSNGPDEVWSPARQVSLPTDDPDAEFPSPARAGGLRLLQWTQTGASAVMGRNIMVGPLDAAGTTVSSARVLSPGAGNHACHNSLAALGSRAWSAWEERLLKSTNWATSESAGTSWTRPERLCSYSSGWRPPALAVTNRGECWVVWAGDAGGVQAMRLP